MSVLDNMNSKSVDIQKKGLSMFLKEIWTGKKRSQCDHVILSV